MNYVFPRTNTYVRKKTCHNKLIISAAGLTDNGQSSPVWRMKDEVLYAGDDALGNAGDTS
jgi:hypothetical protein